MSETKTTSETKSEIETAEQTLYGFPIQFQTDTTRHVTYYQDGSVGTGSYCMSPEPYWHKVLFDGFFALLILTTIYVVSEPRYYPYNKKPAFFNAGQSKI